MYFLIAIWGDSNRRYASYKFFIFTQAGGLADAACYTCFVFYSWCSKAELIRMIILIC